MSDDFVGARAKIIALTAANKILMDDLGQRARDLLAEYGVPKIRELAGDDKISAAKAIDFLEAEILAEG